MTDVLVVGIVFSFLIISVFLSTSEKKDKNKIEAALRMEEMKRGYKPGTYSYKFNRKSHSHRSHSDSNRRKNRTKDFDFEEDSNRKSERADLKNGIDDLMTRINNLEIIMKEEEKNE